MKLDEAIKHIQKGGAIRQVDWDEGDYIFLDGDSLTSNKGGTVTLDYNDIVAKWKPCDIADIKLGDKLVFRDKNTNQKKPFWIHKDNYQNRYLATSISVQEPISYSGYSLLGLEKMIKRYYTITGTWSIKEDQ